MTEVKTLHTSQSDQGDKFYRLLYETSADAIMTIEPPDWRYTSGNPATLKIFGVASEKELLTLTPADLSPKLQPDGQDSKTKAVEMIEKALKDGSNFFDWTHQKYHGDPFLSQVLLTRIKIGEKEILQVTVRDVSQEKKALLDLQKKIAELDKLNKLMIGRELKMVELKKEIERLKHSGQETITASASRFQEGIELEEDVIQALENDYEKMVQGSDLPVSEKNTIIEQLKILLEDSKKHEQALKELV